VTDVWYMVDLPRQELVGVRACCGSDARELTVDASGGKGGTLQGPHHL
jgi:hypothetical protein